MGDVISFSKFRSAKIKKEFELNDSLQVGVEIVNEIARQVDARNNATESMITRGLESIGVTGTFEEKKEFIEKNFHEFNIFYKKTPTGFYDFADFVHIPTGTVLSSMRLEFGEYIVKVHTHDLEPFI